MGTGGTTGGIRGLWPRLHPLNFSDISQVPVATLLKRKRNQRTQSRATTDQFVGDTLKELLFFKRAFYYFTL